MSLIDQAPREVVGARATRKLPSMPQRARRIVLVLHVVSSVGWLGLTIGNLTLGITAVTTDRPQLQHGIYLVLGVIGDFVLLPISLIAFTTGVLLAVGTQWGLLRHKWVLVKFGLTLIAVVLTPLSLLPGIHESIAVVENTPVDQLAQVDTSGLLFAASVSTSMYLTCVVLSVFKPWGRTGYGKRKLVTHR